MMIAVASNLFLYTVFADADKTALSEAYTQITDINTAQSEAPVGEPYYEPNSFQAFTDAIDVLGGLAGIQAVIDDPLAIQMDVDTLTADITTAISGLILNSTYVSTLDNFNLTAATDLSPYTPASQLVFQEELDRIELVLNNPTAGDGVVDALNDDIGAALDLLVLLADKSLLSELNDLVIIAYYEERTTYTASSYAEFKEVVDDYGSYLYINSIINDVNIDQATVDALSDTLQSALDLLVPIVDNSALLILYSTMTQTDLTGYTTASITAYMDELDRLFAIITGDELDAESAAQVVTDMTEATNLLVPLPDMTVLQALYDSTSIYREEDYSISSYGSFENAKLNANNVINNGDATEAMVADAIDWLQLTIDELTQVQETIYINEGSILDINQYITLGRANITSYSVDNIAIATVDVNGVVSALSYGQTQVRITLDNGYTEILSIYVKAKLTTTVTILTFAIPVASIAMGAAIVYIKKETWGIIAKKITTIFKRKER